MAREDMMQEEHNAPRQEQRWKLTIEYEGGYFFGMQRQAQARSVQACLEEALEQLCQRPIKTVAAGRTDRGVHAQGQVVHCDIWRKMEPYALVRALNALLQEHRVRVVAGERVASNFHARLNGVMRYYRYRILLRATNSPLRCEQVWHLRGDLAYDRLMAASEILTGHHDFSSYRGSGCQADSPWRTLCALEWRFEEDECHLYVSAPSFLYRQVRMLCGTMVACARSRLTLGQIEASLTNYLPGITAPPQGLCFLGVDYLESPSSFVPSWLRAKSVEAFQNLKPDNGKKNNTGKISRSS